MNENYKQKILNWLEQKWPKDKRNCEICSTNRWSISEDIVAPIIVEENNNLNIGGKTYPQIMLICSYCGNTKYFNVALMNILKSEK
jgi:hypothetical protein